MKLLYYKLIVAISLSTVFIQVEAMPAADDLEIESAKSTKPLQSTDTNKPATLKLYENETEEITLSDLRNLGLCLLQIKQQAENVYMEVTRRPVPLSAKPTMERPKTIVHLDPADSNRFLPVRPEWITFYVATMEPIIRLLQQDVQDTNSGAAKLFVPKGAKEKFAVIMQRYQNGIFELNQHVTAIYDSVDDPSSNIKIAKSAVDLYNQANKLEHDRQEAYNLIRKHRSDAVMEEVTVPDKH